MKSNECYRLRQILRNNVSNVWTDLFEKKCILNGDDSIRLLFDKLFAETVLQRQNTISAVDLVEIESTINSKINGFLDEDMENNQTNTMEIDSEVDGVRNYVLLKALTQAFKNPDFPINEEFCGKNCFLNCMDYQLIDIIRSKEYKLFVMFWNELTSRIDGSFGPVHEFLGPNYKLVSSFHRKLKNMLNVYQIKHMSSNINFKSNSTFDSQYDGPEFTTRILNFLIDRNGNKKCIPLKSIHSWQKHISQVNEIIWTNWFLQENKFNYNQTLFGFAQESSNKIIEEIKYINSICNTNDRNETDEYLQEIVSKLITFSERAPQNNTETVYLTGIMDSLIGCLELCLSSSTIPLIDPVEKNNLKKKYIEEDIDHLSYMETSYEIMQKVMKYKYLGKEVVLNICDEIDFLKLKKKKYERKSAYRPTICLYKEMSEEIKHFFTTNGNSSNLMAIIDIVDETNQCFDEMKTHVSPLDITGVVKRLDLWITNSQRFLCHTLKKYSTYYKDFTQPIEYSLNTIRLGFESLKNVLQLRHNSIVKLSTGSYMNIESKIKEMLTNIIEFPTSSLNLHAESCPNSDLFHAILEHIDCSGSLYFSLLKAKITEIRYGVQKSGEIDKVTFEELNYVFKMCNQIWNNEEDKRRKSKENKDQLYTTMYVLLST